MTEPLRSFLRKKNKDERKKTDLDFLIVSQFALSQIKGVVKDSISGEPIPYVNIWVENETIGTTSEENGSFVLATSSDKNIVFSILGYDKKTLKANLTATVLLNPTVFDLKEMVILNKKETKQVEIGIIKNSTFQAFDNGPKVEAKFFPYDKSYGKTKFIKEVTIFTDSRIDNATIKLHFYSVDDNGAPRQELLTKDYMVSLQKGVIKHKFNLSNFDLEFPKKGLFVAYEKLLIEQNKQGTKYQPYVLYNYVNRDFFYTYAYGKWTKQEASDQETMGINEPSITLVLSN